MVKQTYDRLLPLSDDPFQLVVPCRRNYLLIDYPLKLHTVQGAKATSTRFLGKDALPSF